MGDLRFRSWGLLFWLVCFLLMRLWVWLLLLLFGASVFSFCLFFFLWGGLLACIYWFWLCDVILTTDGWVLQQFALLIHQIQAPGDAVPSSPPAPTPAPAPPTPSPTSQIDSHSPAPAEVPTSTPAQPPPPPTPTPSPSPASVSSLSSFIRHVRTDPRTRLCKHPSSLLLCDLNQNPGLTMFIFLSFIDRVIVSPFMTLLFVGSMYSFFWMLQIIRSARRGRSSGWRLSMLLGLWFVDFILHFVSFNFFFSFLVAVSVLAHFMVWLDFLACPKNVLDVEPRCERSIYPFSGCYIFRTKVLPNDQRGYTYSCSSGYSSPSFKSASDQLVSSQNGYVYFFFGHFTVSLTSSHTPIIVRQSTNIWLLPSNAPPRFRVTRTFPLELHHLHGRYRPRHSHPTPFQVGWWVHCGRSLVTGGRGGGLLNAMQMCVVGAAKKNYSLAPCHHLFVSLDFWRVCSSVYLSLIY
jgi:hypothetical protein